MGLFQKFFANSLTASNKDTVEKSVGALAESLGTIFKGEGDEEAKRAAFAESLEQFQDHLLKNLTSAPAFELQRRG